MRLEDVGIKLEHGLEIWLSGALLANSSFAVPSCLSHLLQLLVPGLHAELDQESSQGSFFYWVIFNLVQLPDQAQHSAPRSSCCGTAEVNALEVGRSHAGQGGMVGATSVDRAARRSAGHSST